jgi:hypothetical protein
MTTYRDFHRHSIADRESFWAEEAKLVHWQRPFGKVLDYSRPRPTFATTPSTGIWPRAPIRKH